MPSPQPMSLCRERARSDAQMSSAPPAKANGVFRKHHAPQCDFRRVKKLGIGDHIVRWRRPQQCPQTMSLAEFEALISIEVREVHLLIQQRGFRPSQIILVTTLVDLKKYPKAVVLV